jgi:riboflavin synthase alpha subunit
MPILFTTLRKEERLRSQPVKFQTNQKALPKTEIEKTKEKEKVVEMEQAVRNLKYLGGIHFQVR